MANRLGGISLSEIEAASNEQPFPVNAGATPGERFVLRISMLVATRLEKGESGGVAVFLQSDALATDAERYKSNFAPFLANGNDKITEKVWLSNAVLGGAYALDVDCGNLGSIFVSIQDAGFGKLPAVVIDWRGEVPVGRLYSRGIAELEHVQDVEFAYHEISEDSLKDCLDNFHRTSLQTPQRVREGHAEAIWTDSRKGWPAHRPEERIQGKLIQHLRARYTKHQVRAEEKNDDGIADLVIFSHEKSVTGKRIVAKEWVLELKALADHTSTGEKVPKSAIPAAIEKGLTQAIAYREKEHAQRAALCCYDMRAEDDASCFDHISEDATAEHVVLWRWYLFRSSEASRNANRSERENLSRVQA
ncbi:hypothetical protein GOL39_31730 [Sinorhizobium medicae]|uniref:hypothetical protein n=1 Tax=Sinorhizobium medicae TaxID=110321 RepID=UPI000C7C439F|nr:hypothetical protein [Sinorhizobium medicae]MDW9558339.1 hypothetical protein [Sinorhizobium meliloti]MDX0427020.1 hypothetical protein [Sinorhizobium medicae]MDX0974210.1 hypothetical protein [Sinorhizobium medicae]MDX1147065.1 hypothetical protein [Sinorhizobium medicae]PLU54769.1 hypothetical protein BMJ23_19655 [Sinorhizobium medicae]